MLRVCRRSRGFAGARKGPAWLVSVFALAVVGAVGCAKPGPPPGVPTIVVPVKPVSGGPLEVGGSSRAPAGLAADGRSTGDAVDVEWHGSWYPAVLLERRVDGWLVHYEGYDDSYDEVATPSRIRDRSVQVEEEPFLDDPDP